MISYAGEDLAWCEPFAERLGNENVRVWFAPWQLQPGDHLLARLNDGLKNSRKTIAVWSKSYFADHKTWTLAEVFARQQPDVLARERPLIPILTEDCDIPPLFRNILYLDVRNPDDFDLRIRQLLQALDLPSREFASEPDVDFKEHDLPRAERGRAAHFRGKRFEDEVATLYRLLGFDLKQDIKINGVQIDLLIEHAAAGMQAIVECKAKQVTSEERDQILAQRTVAHQELPGCSCIVVSSKGFAADTRTALEKSGIRCFTYAEVLRKLVPLDTYVDGLIADHEAWVNDDNNWGGRETESWETFLYLYAFGPGAWLALLPDGRFDGSPEALRYLCYTQQGTLNSFTAEEVLDRFHDPAAVLDVLANG